MKDSAEKMKSGKELKLLAENESESLENNRVASADPHLCQAAAAALISTFIQCTAADAAAQNNTLKLNVSH